MQSSMTYTLFISLCFIIRLQILGVIE
jgi:hypothetical protein